MDKIGLFWGSTTGNQEEAGKFLVDYMTSEGFEIDSYDIRSTDPGKMLEYKNLIILIINQTHTKTKENNKCPNFNSKIIIILILL